MRTTTVVALLVLLCPSCLPPAGASNAEEAASVVVHFDLDQAAVRPPADVEGFLVLESRVGTAMVVSGSVVLGGGGRTTLHQDGAEPEESEEPEPLVRIDEELQPYETLRVPITVPVTEIGPLGVQFAPDPDMEWFLPGFSEVVGVAPVEVTLADPQDAVQMVGLPGSPAELTVTLTALPGSALTDLRLTEGRHLFEEVVVGDLEPGESRTVTLTVEGEEEMHRPSGGATRMPLRPELSGMEAGQPFTHPLHWSDGDDLLPVRPTAYVGQGSTAFLVPPLDVHLAESTELEVILLNAGTTAVDVEGRVDVRMPGLPYLDAGFDLEERVAPGSVETVSFEWTPPAAGRWDLQLRHDMHRFGHDSTTFLAAGPLSAAEIILPERRDLERGEPIPVRVALTASEDVDVGGLRFTTSRAPVTGVISIDDLLRVERVGGTSIDAGDTETLRLDLTPKATGLYDLVLVVDTPDGPSVHQVGSIEVEGVTGGWSLAWSPTFGLMLLLGAHITWRRRWVQ